MDREYTPRWRPPPPPPIDDDFEEEAEAAPHRPPPPPPSAPREYSEEGSESEFVPVEQACKDLEKSMQNENEKVAEQMIEETDVEKFDEK